MRFASSILRSKLGMKVPSGSNGSMHNSTFSAIPAAHSVLIEIFTKGLLPYLISNQSIVAFMNNPTNEQFAWYQYNSIQTDEIALVSVAGGWDEVTKVLNPTNPRHNYTALFLDRTNNLKRFYRNGQMERSDPMGAVNPNFNTINNRFYININASFPAATTFVLLRLSVLTSVPASMSEIISWQYQFPMELHPDLQALAPSIASQYDFEDINLMPPATNIDDHGIHGNLYPLTSSVSLADKIRIVEKP